MKNNILAVAIYLMGILAFSFIIIGIINVIIMLWK
jgi:hypothetical protein